jgi:hypothetical protein
MTRRSPDKIDTAKIERQLAEIQQREGEDVADCILRLAKMNQAKGRRPGKPRGINRKNLVRKLGKMRKGSDPPIDTAAPAFVEHMRKIQERREADFQKGPMRFMASLFATAEAARRDPKYKQDLEKHGFDKRMVKPWKGSAGRTARSKGKLTKREQAIELRGKGHTEVEIGKIIDRDPRTVRRYLTGR